MAHIIHSLNVTASGSCYHLDSVIDDTHHRYALDLTTSADVLLFGRNTFDLFMQFWPGAADRSDLPAHTVALAKAFAEREKWVVSSHPVALSWVHSSWLQGPGLEQLSARLSQVQGNAVIFGSPGLATSLLNAGLLNELHLLAQPLVGTEEPRAFVNLKQRTELTLLEARPMPSGAVLLRYINNLALKPPEKPGGQSVLARQKN